MMRKKSKNIFTCPRTNIIVITICLATATAFAETLYLPHLAVGGPASGLSATTVVYLTNTSNSPSSGSIEIFDDNGNPLALLANRSGPTSSIFWSLLGGEAVRLELSSNSTSTLTGSVKLNRQSSAVQLAAVFNLYLGGKLDSWVGVPISAIGLKNFFIFYDTTEDRDTGLAIANPSSETARVSIRLVSTGNIILKEVTKTIRPGGHLAEMLGPLFSDISGSSEMTARIQVESPVAAVGMTLMLSGTKLTFLPILTAETEGTVPPNSQ